MAHYTYERLSGQDNDFLRWETSSLPMHVGGTEIFEAGPLRKRDGGIDFEAIKQLTESVLHRIPRYRQKLLFVPGRDEAVWVDDPHFNLDYHFRHTSLPRPGSEEQLKRLTARVMEHALDRSRPLWETWVVEGLEGDRFALINKVHHCMIDGASGVDLSQILLSPSSEREVRPVPRFVPRPHPRPSELRLDSLRRRAMAPLRVARGLARYLQDTPDVIGELLHGARALGDLAPLSLAASETPLNGSVGPHRRVEWRAQPLDQLKAVRHARGCSINDIVLATVTGAVREFLAARQVRLEDLDFRVSSPVNVRGEQDQHRMGNRVSSWVVPLPLDESDPLRQLDRIVAETRFRKETNQAAAVETITQVLQWLPLDLGAVSRGTINMIVTNVPGPPFPLYLLGARMEQIIPLPPLLEGVGLVVALLSYDGRMAWGLNADYDQVPDLVDFADGIDRAFQALASAAGVSLEAAVSRPPAVAHPVEPDVAEAVSERPELHGWHVFAKASGADEDDDEVADVG